MKLPNVKEDYTDLRWALYKESPGTAGCFLKAYKQIDGIKHYYKLSNFSSAIGCYGHESLNEIVAKNIAEIINLPHLDYKLRYGKIIVDDKEYFEYFTDSVDFRKKNESKISFEQYYDMRHEAGETPLDLINRIGWNNDIQKMFVFDFIICNRDRHGSNIEVLNDGINYKLAPFFDNGLSFFFSCYDNIEEIKNHKTNLDIIVNNYIGTRSLKENLLYVSIDILKEMSDISFDRDNLFKGLENVDLPFLYEYMNKVEEVVSIRTDYLREYCKERISRFADLEGGIQKC